MGEIVDLMSAQGMIAGQIYGYVPDPPWGPPHRCPGCQPCPDEPGLAALWNKWQSLETKLRALGESPSCAIMRGEKFPESYTNAERIARGCISTIAMHESPTVAHVESPKPIDKFEQSEALDAPTIGTTVQITTTRKVATKRASKTTKTPKEQGSLF